MDDQKVKAILLVNPNNPTGSFITPDEASELNRIAESRNIALVSDEVFSDYSLPRKSAKSTTFAGNQQVLTFTLSGISKILGLPQMKIGWIVLSAPPSLETEALDKLEVISDTYLSVNTPAQRALPHWLSLRKKIQAPILRRIHANWEFVSTYSQKSGRAELLLTEGGWYAIIKCPRMRSEEEVVLHLLKKWRVLVHPGYFFDFDAEGYCVVSLLPEEKVFAFGITRLFEMLDKLE